MQMCVISSCELNNNMFLLVHMLCRAYIESHSLVSMNLQLFPKKNELVSVDYHAMIASSSLYTAAVPGFVVFKKHF